MSGGQGETRPLPSSLRGSTARCAVLMGQPSYFGGIPARGTSPKGGRAAAYRGRPNRDIAMQQWHQLARAIHRLGLDIFLMPAEKRCPETILAGGAGVVTDRSADRPVADKRFVRATPAGSDHDAHLHFERVVRGLGFPVEHFDVPFAGESDLIEVGHERILTWGDAATQARGFLGRRAPVFGTDRRARERVSEALGHERVIEMRITDARYPRGDLCACGIGPGRRVLMINVNAFDDDSRRVILAGKIKAAEVIIPLTEHDAAMYAANSFHITDQKGRHHLLIADGVSDELLGRIEGAGVHPVLIELSEWIKKDRGGVKSLVCDLGWMCDDRRTQLPAVADFRRSVRFRPE